MENVNPNILQGADMSKRDSSGHPIKPLSAGLKERLSEGEKGPRVLLPTEKPEDVFILEPSSREVATRKRLADAVITNPHDPGTWWELLKHVQTVFGSEPLYKTRLHKLFRKATRVIPENMYNDDWSYTNIWVGFALAERERAEQDCREAFQHMSRAGIGRSHAVFYTSWATFEGECGRSSEAVSIVKRGVTIGAKPTDMLQACLARLHGTPCKPAASSSKGAFPGQLVICETPSPPNAGDKEGDVDCTMTMHRSSPEDDGHTAVITLRQHPGSRGRGLVSAAKPPRQQLVLGALDLSTSSASPSPRHVRQPSSATPRPSHGHGCNDTMAFDASAALDPHNNHTSHVITLRDTDHDANDTGHIHFNTAAPQPPKPTAPQASAPPSSTGEAPQPPPSMPPPPPSRAPLADKSGTAPAKPDSSTAKPRRWQQSSGLLGHGRATRVRAASDSSSASSSAGASTPSSASSLAAMGSPRDSHRGLLPIASSAASAQLTPITEDPAPHRLSQPPEALGSRFSTEGRESIASHASSDHRASIAEPSHHTHTSRSSHGGLPLMPRTPGSALSVDRTLPHGPHTGSKERQRHEAMAQEDMSITRDRGRQAPPAWETGAATAGHGSGEDNTCPMPAKRLSAATSSSSGGAHEAGTQAQADRFSFANLLNPRSVMNVNGTEYLRLDVLGRGGSSKVFRVLSSSGQVFALKRVRVQPGDHRALESFANEITLLQRLKGHPCIIQLCDSLVDPRTGVVLMLMELGETDLNKLLQQSAAEEESRRLSLNFIRYTWEQMLRAVQCAHEERIVHGDLKPANFVFVRGRLKLIDFGIAKAIASDTTNIMRENQVGTVNYMSPEAILDTGSGAEHPVTGRKAPCMKLGRQSDVWSLGCILYQMVYNKTPFADLGLIHKLQAITDEAHAISFPTLDPPLPATVRDTITSCLRRDPQSRATIASLLEHPFLSPSAAPSSSKSNDSVQQVVHATLTVLDRERDILQLSPQARLATLTRRVTGELARAPLSSPPPSSRPQRDAPRPTPAAPSSGTREAAAAPVPPSQRPRLDLSEDLRSQKNKLRPVTEAERQARPKGSNGRGGLYTLLEQDLNSKFRLAHNRDDTNGSSTHESTSTWSFC